MTHEPQPNSEASGGPERDDLLPDATSVPVAERPDELPAVRWEGEWDDGG